jgi:hypothetical protein
MDIEKFLETSFNKEKITEDFYDWLLSSYYDINNIVEVEDYIVSRKKYITLGNNELLTPYRYTVIYDKSFGVDYKVYVAIGEFKPPNKSGFMSIEKCTVILLYNNDFSLYDGELHYDIMHDKE